MAKRRGMQEADALDVIQQVFVSVAKSIEGWSAAAVVCDSILPIYAVSEGQGNPYLVMQYSAGMNLQKRLDVDGPLKLIHTLRIAMQTARGLSAAHAQGLVHRDVKTSLTPRHAP